MPIYFLVGNSTVKASVDAGPMRSFPVAQAVEGLVGAFAGVEEQPAVAASVNPEGEAAVARACAMLGLGPAVYAGRDFPIRMCFDVENATAVGVDRALNVKAAFARAGRAVGVIDMGTATSISVSDDNGTFLGGAITAGLTMSLRSLCEGTALLPQAQLVRPLQPIGRDTKSAMCAGVFYGAIGAMREIIARIERQTGRDLAVFVTGGDSRAFTGELPGGWTIDPGLTMEGLRIAYGEYLSQGNP